jgi:hypothetical protein
MVQHTHGGKGGCWWWRRFELLLIVDEEIVSTLPFLSPPSVLETITVFRSVFVGRYVWGGSDMDFMG